MFPSSFLFLVAATAPTDMARERETPWPQGPGISEVNPTINLQFGALPRLHCSEVTIIATKGSSNGVPGHERSHATGAALPDERFLLGRRVALNRCST